MNVKNVSDYVNVSIKTESQWLVDDTYCHYCHVLTVHGVITHINQLKGIYFLKVKEILELISCQTSDAIPVVCVPKGH